MNYARLRAFAGTKEGGIRSPLPRVAVRIEVRRNRESLKDPSSYTTPVEYFGFRLGNTSKSYYRFMK
jgi:hypothetical protein